VAIGLIVEVLGQAIDAVASRISHERSRTVEWLREVTRPPPGVQLHAPDGSIYTGMIVFDSNRAVVVLALRRLPTDQQRSVINVQSEFPFSHRDAVYDNGADDR
jgi:hypothetical protein